MGLEDEDSRAGGGLFVPITTTNRARHIIQIIAFERLHHCEY